MLVRQRLLSPEILKKVKDSERINTEKLWKKYHFHCHNYFLKTPYQMGIFLKPSENAFLFKILMRISHLQLFLQRKYRSSWPDVFIKNLFLKFLQNIQESTCAHGKICYQVVLMCSLSNTLKCLTIFKGWRLKG